jgi:flagellar L-ring protein precursor FlgH
MKTNPSKRLAVLLAAACSALPVVATAADALPPRGPQAPAGRPSSAGQAAVRTQYDPAINDTAVAIQKSGGSLLRAQLASARPNPDGGRQMRDVSFFAVPEPEPKTIRKHDLITIVVHEESQSSSQGTTDFKRQTDLDAHLDEFIKFKIPNFAIQGGAQGAQPPGIKASGTRNFTGTGQADRTDVLTTRVTGEVVDVKPNGTLVLQARKAIKTDEEEQSFVMTGTCRVEDVVADNTVLSTQLYDLRVEKTHKGAVTGATKRNWLGKILDAVAPF